MTRASRIENITEVGDRLRLCRLVIGAKTKDVAAQLNIVAHRWSQWERGRRTPAVDVISRFVRRHRFSLDYIYLGDVGRLTVAERNSLDAYFKSNVEC
jgi:transcriptional regulator with XRE-family HTH domain